VIRGSRGSSGSICGGERFAGKRAAATPPNRVLDAETLAAAERLTSGRYRSINLLQIIVLAIIVKVNYLAGSRDDKRRLPRQ
jgi:hypothetical protein